MRTKKCPTESAIMAAVRAGDVSPDVNRHLARCEDCAETFAVAQSLNRYAQSIAADNLVPDSHMLWRRMQQRRQEAALARMNRVMALSYAIAAVYLVVLVVWFLPSHMNFSAEGIFREVPGQLLAAGSTVAIVSIALGLLCLKRLDLPGRRWPDV